MKTLLSICVVGVAALAGAGCLSETAPRTEQSEAVSAVETACDPIDEPGDGTVLFCYIDHNMCCCDHVDMSTGEIFGQSCLGEE
jgi:hypothetical protein